MHIEDAGAPEHDTPGWQFAVTGGILGWVLDAFDFFVVVFLINELMAKFHVGKPAIVWSLTATLAMRPLGALLFGALGDKFGRKKPLIGCVIYFSTVTVLTAFAPTYTVFLVLRALYGIGMGGYWGIGASYAMESAPRRQRGFLSGMMQGGYPFGYLCAAIGMQTIAPRYGWQAMFLVGSSVALLIVVLTLFAPESDAWKQHRMPSIGGMFATLYSHIGIFSYLLVLMMAMTCLSHGTQDLYPDFLKTLSWMKGATIFGMKATLGIPVVYNIGAIVGALSIGQLSESIGRRYAILLALVLCLLSIPAWAFGGSVMAIVLGSSLMQLGVQGAFGVIPAHLNELSPDAIRSLFPGFVYQLGVLASSPALPIQNLLQRRFGYPWALTSFELVVILSLMVIFWLGPEKRGRSFRSAAAAVETAKI
ncbi:MFS transporter [Acidipila rosea]|uniref:SHS family lactate transporter-like MFS transporter n=1 Tax=Acidipila rosea TaxID=768535 RepID=A0A4R1L3P8_9BACT|nr:MFS transporter [Acidipila rosea]MBW4026367.1 MFS transporter [Acidobacteriota bacterium]MBW4044498.1 MFS transporter [Acidobacteriota bacterium]TCK72676.1 SHS family lactate transporter-like MFS transporter [Acidipila rosea]